MTDRIYALWFNNIKGVGNKTKALLLGNINNYEDIYKAGSNVYEQIVGTKLAEIISNSKNLDLVKNLSFRMEKENIKFTYVGHSEYPERLLHIYDYPFSLYYRGLDFKDIINNNLNISIVGSRKATFYGSELAYSYAKNMSLYNINTISGLAFGIDSQCHKGSVDVKGYTIGVLGCGINVVYPPSNRMLYERVMNCGTIISEYGLDVQPKPGMFPQRNRIISGFSDGILVVEAKNKSGSLITANCALEQGKTVMAIPGRVTDVNSIGCNNLIKQGAYCICDFKDIREIFSVPDKNNENVDTISHKSENRLEKENNLAPIEKIVYSCLSLEPKYIDDILKVTNLKVTDLINTLLVLELNGYIKQPIKGYYIISL